MNHFTTTFCIVFPQFMHWLEWILARVRVFQEMAFSISLRSRLCSYFFTLFQTAKSKRNETLKPKMNKYNHLPCVYTEEKNQNTHSNTRVIRYFSLSPSIREENSDIRQTSQFRLRVSFMFTFKILPDRQRTFQLADSVTLQFSLSRLLARSFSFTRTACIYNHTLVQCRHKVEYIYIYIYSL